MVFNCGVCQVENDQKILTYGERLSMPDIFHNIGYAHHNTLQTVTIDKEKVKNSFTRYWEKCLRYRERFDHYMDEFEQKRYMSPVELLVCTHYRDVDYLFHELSIRIEQFNAELSEVNNWKLCRCYGDKNIEYLLRKGHLYQNSQEHFHHANAALDVVALIRCHTNFFEWENTELAENIALYRKINPLDQIELSLLAIYLLDPIEYLSAVEDFATKATKRSMMEHVIILKQKHRFLFRMSGWTSRNLVPENDTD